MNPQVSAVIPTRHRPGSLLRAVESALAQTHSPAEVVVVIDGPDPATESMLGTMTDERLRVLALPAAVGGFRGAQCRRSRRQRRMDRLPRR